MLYILFNSFPPTTHSDVKLPPKPDAQQNMMTRTGYYYCFAGGDMCTNSLLPGEDHLMYCIHVLIRFILLNRCLTMA